MIGMQHDSYFGDTSKIVLFLIIRRQKGVFLVHIEPQLMIVQVTSPLCLSTSLKTVSTSNIREYGCMVIIQRTGASCYATCNSRCEKKQKDKYHHVMSLQGQNDLTLHKQKIDTYATKKTILLAGYIFNTGFCGCCTNAQNIVPGLPLVSTMQPPTLMLFIAAYHLLNHLIYCCLGSPS